MTINQKLKIAHVITGLYTGGAEMMLYNLLSRTNREIFSPVVISLMNRGTLSDRIESLNVPVYTAGIPLGGLPTPSSLSQLVKIISHHQPDLIQGWMYHGNLAARLASVFSRKEIPVVWDIQHSVARLANEKGTTQAIIKLNGIISRYISKIVYASENSKRQHEQLGYYSQNSCVIPNGFDTTRFQPSDAARANMRIELGLSHDAFLIGLICRFHPMKDHYNFLQAAAILQEEFPDVHFLLVGRDVDGNNKVLQQWIQQLKLSHIHLLGERKDIPIITEALDIASSSSAYGEAFPMIAGEAMSCCVPCVMTDVGDSAWAVGDTGRIVPPRDPAALANAWKDLLVMDDIGRKALGEAARARVIKYFSIESVTEQFEDLYKDILSSLTDRPGRNLVLTSR